MGLKPVLLAEISSYSDAAPNYKYMIGPVGVFYLMKVFMKLVELINLKIIKLKKKFFFHAQLSEWSMKKVSNVGIFYVYDQVKYHAQLS